MEQGKIVYKNNGFSITENPRRKNYDNDIINKYDKIYRISLFGNNQPTIEDASMLIYYLLKNKIIDFKFVEYKNIIIHAIIKAEIERDEFKEKINKNLNMW